jgi:hypothetical protein
MGVSAIQPPGGDAILIPETITTFPIQFNAYHPYISCQEQSALLGTLTKGLGPMLQESDEVAASHSPVHTCLMAHDFMHGTENEYMGSETHTALCYGSTFHSSLRVDCKYRCRAQWSSIRTSGQTSDQNKKEKCRRDHLEVMGTEMETSWEMGWELGTLVELGYEQ